jgi:FkbM family methyltransferase
MRELPCRFITLGAIARSDVLISQRNYDSGRSARNSLYGDARRELMDVPESATTEAISKAPRLPAAPAAPAAPTGPTGHQLATRVAGGALADEVEEYFERGASVARGDVVFDVGANVGAFAAAVAARTGQDVTLHCFEPAWPSFARLGSAFESDPALRGTRHELHALALTRRELHGTTRPFYYFRRLPTDSTYDLPRKLLEFEAFFAKKAREIEAAIARWSLAWLGGGVRWLMERVFRVDNRFMVWVALRATGMHEMQCRLASLESVVAERDIGRIDLLKIDVEGAELDVLRGCGAAWPKIRQVAVETDEREGRADAVIHLLAAQGFSITSCAAPRVAAAGGARQLLVVARRP